MFPEELTEDGARRMRAAREHSERLKAESQTHDARPRPSVPSDGTPYVKGSTTSQQAALSVTESVGNLREKVLLAISQRPITDEEGIELTGLNPSTYRPRRVELAKMGVIEGRGVRRTSSGRSAVVWGAK